MADSGEHIDPEQAKRVLEVLCAKYGFCLPPLWRARLIDCPPRSAEKFVHTVFAAEGLNPHAVDPKLLRSVHQEVREAFDRSST